MKFLKIFILIIGFQNLIHAQIQTGRYRILLETNQKALQINGFGTIVFRPSCAPNAYCDYQYWDVKPVRGIQNQYHIEFVTQKSFMTFSEEPNTNNVEQFVRLQPIKPVAQRRTQSFFIKEVAAGKFVIQPSRATSELNKDNDVFLTVDSQDLYRDEIPLKLRKSANDGGVNLIVNFIPVKAISTVKVTQIQQNSATPSIFVTPKSENKLDLDFKTGSDNLEPKDFMEGLKVTLKIRNKADIVRENVNEGKEWPNNSFRRVTIDLPADVQCSEIAELILSRNSKSGSKDNITGISGDNWNLDKLTITSRFKTDGVLKSNSMDYISPSGSNFPLFRFIYEKRNNDKNSGTSLTLNVNGICSSQNNTTNVATNANAKITCIFETGGDNLEGGNDNNVDITIRFKKSAKVLTIRNINNTAKWNNFTENTVTKEVPISSDIDINDIKEVEVRHTGGGGMFADNWHVDKIKITIFKNGQSKILVDRVGAPIHMFTGDTRSKRFNVE